MRNNQCLRCKHRKSFLGSRLNEVNAFVAGFIAQVKNPQGCLSLNELNLNHPSPGVGFISAVRNGIPNRFIGI